MPKAFPIGFEMAQKNVSRQTDRQTDRHFRIYISRDIIYYFVKNGNAQDDKEHKFDVFTQSELSQKKKKKTRTIFRF